MLWTPSLKNWKGGSVEDMIFKLYSIVTKQQLLASQYLI